MGYAVIHMEKYGKGAVGGIQVHNNRQKVSISNPDIDTLRSNLNYHLAPCTNYYKSIKQKINDYAVKTKTIRKDAVLLCSFVITSDEQTMKSMSDEQQKEFFQDSVEFLGKRYGRQNIVSATVHMDETTPHMHVCIVPITSDGRLSAKSIFTRKELTQLQTDFAKDVGATYNLERGVEGSENKHLSETRFKVKKTEEKLERVKQELGATQKTLSNASKRLQIERDELEGIKPLLTAMKSEYEAKKGYNDDRAIPSTKNIRKETRGLIKKETVVVVPIQDWRSLKAIKKDKEKSKELREQAEKMFDKFYKTIDGQELKRYHRICENLDTKLKTEISEKESIKAQLTESMQRELSLEFDLRTQRMEFTKKLKEKDVEVEKLADKVLKRIDKVLSKMSIATKEQFFEIWSKELDIEKKSVVKKQGMGLGL